jgi:hypothetical protein
MNLEEFGPDAKDEMSPSEYIQYCLEQYREYRILAADPTINAQATKLYLDKASEYYTQAQEAMDEIEPDMTDHLSDEDKALPNVSLADQENELNNNNNTNEMFTKQSRQYDQWADDNDRLKAIKAAKAAELSDKDKAMIDKYEDDEKEQEDSEMNKIDAKMYRESISGIGGTGGSQPTILFSDIRSKLIEIETLINQLKQTDEYKMGNEVGNKIGPKAFAFIGAINTVINVFRERGYIKEDINLNRWDKLAGLDK